MTDEPRDLSEIPPPPDRPREGEGSPTVEHAPSLMPDLRGETVHQGRDPEEVDPVRHDETRLRHATDDPVAERP